MAREIFALLPINEIIITSISDLLNTTTGKIEKQPILSVKYLRESMQKINFNNIDPSDAMANFIHNMGFKKSVSMSAVKIIED